MKARQILKLSALALFSQALPFFTRAGDLVGLIGTNNPAALKVPWVEGPEIWKDPSQSLDARVQDLVRRMSLAEKTSQLSADAAAIPRLGIAAYSYRNECLHGDARAGIATVFPQVIGMAATWDTPLIHDEADVIATEARAKFNDYTRAHDGNSAMHFGVSFYAPNLNIVRDPRWGRGQETYGEDPFLTGQMGVAFIQGLQGNDAKYVKAMACAKHFAVHSGPEPLRTSFDAKPSERDLYETYLPAFEAAVREGRVGAMMGAYSALNGVPDCENPFLLTRLLRQQWGFDGFVVSDGGAIMNNWADHKYEATPEEAAGNAVKAGCDLFSGRIAKQPPAERFDNEALGHMLQKGLLPEAAIDRAVSRTLAARFRLGLFDPPSLVPWSSITLADNDTPGHQALALKVARESIVLLKNSGLLPLNRAKLKRIAVIGPNADSVDMLCGNYNGTPSHPITILNGIKQVAGTGIEVTFATGCPLALKTGNSNQPAPALAAQAVSAAKSADVVVYVGGIDSTLESEAGGKTQCQGFLGGDRTRLELPAMQEELLAALRATGKPVIFVNCSGSAMALPWEAEHLPAMVQAWYPGEQGGIALAEVLFGDVNPAGRLPVTFYRSTGDLPAFNDYSMSNRTYRYFHGKPLFAFGYGLSYTRFRYAGAELNAAIFGPHGAVKLSFTLENTGERDGDEVAQVYFRHVHSSVPQPKLALCGFTRIHLTKGKRTTVTMDIPAERFRYWDTAHELYAVEPGDTNCSSAMPQTTFVCACH